MTVITQELVELGFRLAKGRQNLAVCSNAIRVLPGGCDNQDDLFLLYSGKRLVLQENRARNVRLDL